MLRIGELSLWLALAMAAWGAITGIAGERLHRDELVASARRAAYVTAGLLAASTAGLWRALLAPDLTLVAVAGTTTTNLPRLYRAAALWASPAGAVLLWSALAVAALAFAMRTADATGARGRRAVPPYLPGFSCALILPFLLLLSFVIYPFARLDFTPADGLGMAPELQHPLAVLHGMALLLGLATTSVPFVYALAGLLARQSDREWLEPVRRWSIVSWILLTAAITLGLRWAYALAPSATGWVWEPVRAGWMLPWLAVTATLHGVGVVGFTEAPRRLAAALAVGGLLLAVFVAFLPAAVTPPTGGAAANLGPWMAVVVVALTTSSALLLATARSGDGNEMRRDGAASARGTPIAGAAVLCGMIAAGLLAVALGSLVGERAVPRLAVPLRAFEWSIAVLGIVALTLSAVGQVLPPRRAASGTARRLVPVLIAASLGAVAAFALGGTGVALHAPLAVAGMAAAAATFASCGMSAAAASREMRRAPRRGGWSALGHLLARRSRRGGVLIAHLGMAVCVMALAGVAIGREHEVALAAGQRFDAADHFGARWVFVSQGLSRYPELNRDVAAVLLEARREGERRGHLKAERRTILDARGRQASDPVFVPGVLSLPGLDVFVAIRGLTADRAELTVAFLPLVRWLSYGGIVAAIGALIAVMPTGAGRTRPEARSGEALG